VAGYVIANVEVQDAAQYEEYKRLVPASIEKYQGRFLVRAGNWERMEGSWEPKRLVVIEFPTAEQARRWYDSEEYQQARAIREQAASGDLLIVEGISACAYRSSPRFGASTRSPGERRDDVSGAASATGAASTRNGTRCAWAGLLGHPSVIR
jgi:uncharacterized protein (DUF1330 family)